MEFKVGQRFRVPNTTWTITKIDGFKYHILIEYADGSMPSVSDTRSLVELQWLISVARQRGRLIEDPETVEE